MSSTEVKLPAWANYTAQINPENTSLQKEEFHLRQNAYRHAVHHLADAYHSTLKHTMESNLTIPILDFFEKFQCHDRGNYNLYENDVTRGVNTCRNNEAGSSTTTGIHTKSITSTTARTEGHATTAASINNQKDGQGSRESVSTLQQEIHNLLQTQSQSTIQFHPTILPIAIVHTSSSSTLDRSQIILHLMRQFQSLTQNTNDRTRTNMSMNMNTNPSSRKRKLPHHGKLQPAICHLSTSSSISSSSPSHKTSYRDHGECIMALLQQCISQEPNPYIYSHLLSKRNVKSMLGGYTQRLVEYASLTTTKNSIVVILDDGGLDCDSGSGSGNGSNSGEEFWMLLRILRDLRLESGLPVCIVIPCTALGGERMMGKLDGWDGAGSFVREFWLEGCKAGGEASKSKLTSTSTTMPRKGVGMVEFLDELGRRRKDGFRFLWGRRLLESIGREYQLYHGSMAQVFLQLKEVLAHIFSKRGSFLAMAHDPVFLRAYGINIAWFCAEPIARKYIFGNHSNSNASVSANFDDSGDLLQHMHGFDQEVQYRITVCNLLCKMRECISEKDDERGWNRLGQSAMTMGMFLEKNEEFSATLEQIYNQVRQVSLEDLIVMLSQWYGTTCKTQLHAPFDNMEGGEAKGETKVDLSSFLHSHSATRNENVEGTDAPEEQVEDKISEVNEFLRSSICLLAALQAQDGEETIDQDVVHDFRESIVEELHGFLWDNEKEWLNSPFAQFTTFGIAEDDASTSTSYLSSLSVELRRSMASAISIPESLDNDCSFDLSVAFHIMDGRVILSNIWFDQFAEKVLSYADEGVTPHELLQRFAFAVYQLMYCGFIVRSRRKDDAFEKAAMVWASSH